MWGETKGRHRHGGQAKHGTSRHTLMILWSRKRGRTGRARERVCHHLCGRYPLALARQVGAGRSVITNPAWSQDELQLDFTEAPVGVHRYTVTERWTTAIYTHTAGPGGGASTGGRREAHTRIVAARLRLPRRRLRLWVSGRFLIVHFSPVTLLPFLTCEKKGSR